MSSYAVHHGDCVEVMGTLEENSVDLIIADFPYFKVKADDWDNQWNKRSEFLAWVDTVLKEFHRVLRPNGSVYSFASPQMGRHVANTTDRWFNILNEIRWVKDEGWHKKAKKEDARSFTSPWELVIFAEHHQNDPEHGAELAYKRKDFVIKGEVFSSLREYLDGERGRSGWSVRDVAVEYQKKTGSRTVTGMAGHWFQRSQWELPTAENYEWLRRLLNGRRAEYEYLRAEYEDLRAEYEYLRAEYEDLRAEYEDLRRPFNVSADVPYTDVWTFPTVQTYPGKHPTEKPYALIEHIVRASSRDGATVLDPFSGSGVTGEVCGRNGRNVILIDKTNKWYRRSLARTAAAYADWQTALMPQPIRSENGYHKLPLFSQAGAAR